MTARWIPGFEGHYKVTDQGVVISTKRKTQATMKLWPRRDGYLQVQLRMRGRANNRLVHTLVASAFIGAPPDGQEVNHIDGNKQNNGLENLEYVSKSANMKHAFSRGLRCTAGELHPRRKLSREVVSEIRQEILRERQSGRKYGVLVSIQKNYGLSRNTVRRIAEGTHWAC